MVVYCAAKKITPQAKNNKLILILGQHLIAINHKQCHTVDLISCFTICNIDYDAIMYLYRAFAN